MNYLGQVWMILGFSFAGECLQRLLPLPIPAAIYGIILLFTALCCGIVKLKQIRETSEWLLSIMPVLFVAPAVNLLEYWGIIAPQIFPLCLLVIVSTVLAFAISGSVTQWMLPPKGDTTHE